MRCCCRGEKRRKVRRDGRFCVWVLADFPSSAVPGSLFGAGRDDGDGRVGPAKSGSGLPGRSALCWLTWRNQARPERSPLLMAEGHTDRTDKFILITVTIASNGGILDR